MPLITRLMLQNFKKFPELDLRFILLSFLPGELTPKTKISTVKTVISVKIISGQKQGLIP